jgi:hypothetical protein
VSGAAGRSAEVLRAQGRVGVEAGTAGYVWLSHISHIYKDRCGLAQAKDLPSLIYHEPAIKVKFMRGAAGTTRILTIRERLSETSHMWARAVAPFAEGIARALWSMTSKRARTDLPATRLTQSRKREAKGIRVDIPIKSDSRPPAVCRICGVTIKPGFKYCRGCVPEISRKNVREAAKVGRLATHSPKAEARRADTQRRQAAALKAWNPKDKPEWLDEKKYRQSIQPSLVGIMVPIIMSAISVSEPYALRIRNGKCVPHPRHWLALAELTGHRR